MVKIAKTKQFLLQKRVDWVSLQQIYGSVFVESQPEKLKQPFRITLTDKHKSTNYDGRWLSYGWPH